MRAQAKRLSAANRDGSATRGSVVGSRDDATRASSPSADGSRAPSRRRLPLVALAAALMATLVFATSASAASYFFDSSIGTATGTTGGLFNTPSGIAVNTSAAGGVPAGTFYVADSANNRIQQFNPDKTFARAWGQNVAGRDERQLVRVSGVNSGAGGGTFRLTFGANTTANIAANASAATVQTALTGLASIGAGNATVAGSASAGWTVRFVGTLSGTDVAQLTADGAGLLGPSPAISVSTVENGSGGNFTGFEICAVAAACQDGSVTGTAVGGQLNAPKGIAVDQSDGSVYVTDQGNIRVQKFDADGDFQLAFGKDVLTGGVTTTEVCAVAASCKIGVTGTLGGEFASTFAGYPTVAPVGAPNAGNVIVADPANRRVQEFSSSGAFVRAIGWGVTAPAGGADNVPGNERQTVTLTGTITGGTFTLTFNGGTGNRVTAAIAFNAPPSGPGSVQEALEALDNLNPGDIVVTSPNPGGGAAPGGPYTVEFTGARADADVNQMFSDATGLTPNGGITRETIVPGLAFEVCTQAVAGAANCLAGSAGTGTIVGKFANNSPTRIAEDSTAAIYAVDSGNDRLQKFIPQVGQPPFSAAVFASGVESQSSPTDVQIGASNRVFVVKAFDDGTGDPLADVDQRRVLELNSSGTLLDTNLANAGTNSINSVNGLAFDGAADRIYLSTTESSSHRVLLLDSDGLAPIDVDVNAPTGVGVHCATFNATVNPNGPIGHDVSYRFEYSSNAGATWIKAKPEQPIGDDGIAHTVIDTVCGLQADTDYQLRLVATRANATGGAISAPLAFSTQAAAGPEVQGLAPTLVDSDSAELAARINPNNHATNYFFQYGTDTSYGTRVPIPSGSVGSGGDWVTVTEQISGLSPDTTYHFRVVAQGASTVSGPDRTFTTLATDGPPAPPAGERVYEQVTPRHNVGNAWGITNGDEDVDTNSPFIHYVAVTGERLLIGSVHPFDSDTEPGSSTGVKPNLVERTSEGWRATALAPLPLDKPALGAVSGTVYHGDGANWTPNLSVIAFSSSYKLDPRDTDVNMPGSGLARDFYLYRPDQPERGYELLTCPPPPGGSGLAPNGPPDTANCAADVPAGAPRLSADGSTITFGTGETFLDGAGDPLFPTASGIQLYAHRNGDFAWVSQPLDFVPAGATQLSGSQNLVSWQNPVSRDGSRIFFTGGGRVYVRVDERTLEVSRVRGGSSVAQTVDFRGASSDGNRALILTPQRLLPQSGDNPERSDPNTLADLYLWSWDPDSDPGNDDPNALTRLAGLAQVGPGPALEGQAVVNVADATDDLSRVYLVTALGEIYLAQLPPGDPAAGTVRHIGVGSPNCIDQNTADATCARTPPSGRYLAFESNQQLTPDDTDAKTDVYLYDAQANSLERASKGDAGGNGAIDARLTFETGKTFDSEHVTDSGQVFFMTEEGLVVADTNAPKRDVYGFTTGDASAELISRGGGPFAVTFAGMSTDGRDVFLVTADSLAPGDTEGGSIDFYDARAGGGFPEVPEVPCEGEACRGAGSSAPDAIGAGSAAFQGPGNPQAQPAPRPCPRGKRKVRRGGKTRCVSKGNKRPQKNRANHDRRASR